MINENMSKKDVKHEAIFHAVMMLIWIGVAIFGYINRSHLTWVSCIIAVAYLALDEAINVFFFWRYYHGERVPEVSEKVIKETTKEE